MAQYRTASWSIDGRYILSSTTDTHRHIGNQDECDDRQRDHITNTTHLGIAGAWCPGGAVRGMGETERGVG